MCVQPSDQLVSSVCNRFEDMAVAEIQRRRIAGCFRFPYQRAGDVCEVLSCSGRGFSETELFQTSTTYSVRRDGGIRNVVEACVELAAATLTDTDVDRAWCHRVSCA